MAAIGAGDAGLGMVGAIADKGLLELLGYAVVKDLIEAVDIGIRAAHPIASCPR